MNQRTVESIKSDFRAWSGGFSPESKHQILVYTDYALNFSIDPAEAFPMLLDWMNAPDIEADFLDSAT